MWLWSLPYIWVGGCVLHYVSVCECMWPWVCMCVSNCAWVYMWLSMSVWLSICVCDYLCVYVTVDVCLGKCVRDCVCKWLRVWTCVLVCVCMCVCDCICVWTVCVYDCMCVCDCVRDCVCVCMWPQPTPHCILNSMRKYVLYPDPMVNSNLHPLFVHAIQSYAHLTTTSSAWSTYQLQWITSAEWCTIGMGTALKEIHGPNNHWVAATCLPVLSNSCLHAMQWSNITQRW